MADEEDDLTDEEKEEEAKRVAEEDDEGRDASKKTEKDEEDAPPVETLGGENTDDTLTEETPEREEKNLEGEEQDAEAKGEDTTPDKTAEGAAEQVLHEAQDRQQPSTNASSPVSRYQDFLDQYNKLQQNRRSADVVNGLIAAGGKIGQSMAGKYSGNFTPDQQGNQMLAKMAEQPTQQLIQGMQVQGSGLQLKQQMESQDPNSNISEAYRNYFKQRIMPKDPKTGHIDTSMFPNIDQYSASDVQNLLKTIGKPQADKALQVPLVNQKTGEKQTGVWSPVHQTFTSLDGQPMGADWIRDYRAQSFIDPKTLERLGFSGGTGKVTGPLTGPGVNAPVVPENPGDLNSKQPIQINRSFLNGQQAKQVDATRHQFIQEVKDDRNNLNSTDRVIAALQAGQELGDLPREEQDQLNRAFGQKGHISDAQIGVTLGKPDWKNRFTNAISIGSTGKLTDENRQFLLDTLKVIRDQNQQYIDNKSQIYTNNLYNDLKTAPNLQKYKFGPDSAKGLLGVEAARNPQLPGAPKQLKEKKSGQIVPIKADKYDAALKSGLFEEVQ